MHFKIPAVLAALLLVGGTAAPIQAEPMPPAPIVKKTDAMCANFLNFVPRIVRPETVAGIGDDAHVVVHAFCKGVTFYGSGNASGLRKTIAGNDALSRALAANGWRADEVVALAVRGNTVDVYVHRN